ncbi:LysR family transcriptional regulator [Paenibacillus chondroitinus]|uniref:LysR family transcriptional regulator n=1 Tax=Paenibacillus chondroitinus TaxID=59842 RepID=A0ABU6DHS0_9BACL|nr:MULTISPECIES: LysR family transcriptional regulator [Paenibacillus]MCY9659297.1 LysR family transcriptional regulator [Paenibacillus anseongense]MEB4796367.1 LysR family transcriptional regulator [Paenibacillus chondroitinus]
MEFRQLEYFAAICEELHFTRAAEKLGMSQPTLSHQIKMLEDELGVPLFDRIGKKIAITEAGHILLNECKVIFSSIKNVKVQIIELQKVTRGTLSIGALPGELTQLVSSLLIDFHQIYPEVQIKIINFDDVVERVIQNQIDLAITILPVEDDRVVKYPLYKEDIYLTVSKDHALAERESINFDEISKHPFIMFPQTHKCRQIIDLTSSTSGFHIEPIIETTAIETIIGLVKADAGVTALSRTYLNLYNDTQLKAIKIENPTLSREIAIIHHKDKYLSQAARLFMDLLSNHIVELKLAEEMIVSN